LKSANRPLRLNEIAMVLGKKAPGVHKHLAGLIAAGFVEQPKYGHYKLHDSSDGQSG
jgi:Mn-dependent DtxR family transcriptional regulator